MNADADFFHLAQVADVLSPFGSRNHIDATCEGKTSPFFAQRKEQQASSSRGGLPARLEDVEAEQSTPPLQQLGKFQVRHVVMRKTLLDPKALAQKGSCPVECGVLCTPLKTDFLDKKEIILLLVDLGIGIQKKASACKLPVPQGLMMYKWTRERSARHLRSTW